METTTSQTVHLQGYQTEGSFCYLLVQPNKSISFLTSKQAVGQTHALERGARVSVDFAPTKQEAGKTEEGLVTAQAAGLPWLYYSADTVEFTACSVRCAEPGPCSSSSSLP